METNLEGKTVLITEAVLNFGQATSLAFAREGCNLLLATREGNEQLQKTAQEASSLGAKVATQVCDISDQGHRRTRQQCFTPHANPVSGAAALRVVAKKNRCGIDRLLFTL